MVWKNPTSSLMAFASSLEAANAKALLRLRTASEYRLCACFFASSIAIQYIAMKLQQAGADEVYGLSFVKTLRDEDNT